MNDFTKKMFIFQTEIENALPILADFLHFDECSKMTLLLVVNNFCKVPQIARINQFEYLFDSIS